MVALSDPALAGAFVAGGFAVAVALINVVPSLSRHSRETHRETLNDSLQTLASDLNGIMATSTTYLKRIERGQDPKVWIGRMERHRDSIKVLRTELRYHLNGLDDALRFMTRVGDYVQHYKADVVEGTRFLGRADLLRQRVDAGIANAYERGRPPSRWKRWRVKRALRDVSAFHQEWMKRGD